MSRGRDGARLAYALGGAGAPLVWTGSWITHLELDWHSPVWRHWIHELSERYRLLRYDLRGSGLSEPDAGSADIETWVEDLDAIVDAAGLERFSLLGVCQGGAIALAYAALRPERVNRLILYGGYARGALARGSGSEAARQVRALTDLIELGWGRDHSAFRDVFAKMLMPRGPVGSVEFLGEIQRKAASPENAARLWTAFHSVDVSELAERVAAPTLVAHVRGDAMVPVEEGERLASKIPQAELVTLDGDNHILMEDDPSWPTFVEEVASFLAGSAGRDESAGLVGLTPREREVLDRVARGLSNGEIAEELGLREKTVRNHVSNVVEKMGVPGRSRAIVVARRAGFG